jgi:GNAT superfamily N-acetyltransferase
LSYEVVKLGPPLEEAFERHARRDVPHHFFFLFDWIFNRDRTEIWLALRENGIQGMMLVYDRRVIQLRGSETAAEALLNEDIDLEKVEFNVEPQHRQVVLEKFPPSREYEMMLMTLRRDQEHLYPSERVVRLTPANADGMAALMRSASPEFWGTVKLERITASLDRTLWVGVFADGKLVSLGNTALTDFASNVGAVATHDSYRNRGHATAVVSALLREILRVNDLALIHVLKDNMLARRVYEKVGFKPYRNYFFGFAERSIHDHR